ncbi:MAG: serine hydrolase domain-containing protein [Terriglobales bacterium]|jgi:serine beta-lactamase-like protein LACTB, mitochondrial
MRVPALLFVALVFLPAPAVPQAVHVAPEKRVQLEAAITRFMAANSTPGVSVAVVENGAEEWSAGFGSADLENFVPATSHTLYRLGSISKSITATAALLLWQEGKLDLDSPVQKYCSSFPQKNATITTRELLGHLGGIRHYKSGSQDDPEIGNTKHFLNPILGGIDFFKNDPLVAKPGTEFHYSTHGYTLVGCAIEGASGENYVDFVRKHVLTPAGMTHTVVDDRFAIIPFRTRFYSKDKSGAITNADFLDSSYKTPGGGWLSSADDMAQFEVAMLNDRIVARSTRDLMWTPLKPTDGKEDRYALGWGTGKDLGVLDVGHSGSLQGTSTFFMIVPERRAGIVVLINLEDGNASDLGKDLMKIVLASATAPAK